MEGAREDEKSEERKKTFLFFLFFSKSSSAQALLSEYSYNFSFLWEKCVGGGNKT